MNELSRRRFLKTTMAAGVALSMPSFLSQALAQAKSSVNGTKPNVVLLQADDLGYSDISCCGSEINTPNIDSLFTDNGIMFSHVYTYSKCEPTRLSLITGLQPYTQDMAPGEFAGVLNDNGISFGSVMKSAGYSTCQVGKWDVAGGGAQQQGFDRMFCYNCFDKGPGDYWEPTGMNKDGLAFSPPNDYFMTDGLAEYSADFIREQVGKPNPFFMYISFKNPHWPLQAKAEDIARFKGSYDGGWDQLRQSRFERQKQRGLVDPSWTLPPMNNNWATLSDSDKKDFASRMEVYAAQVYNLDQNIGRILSALKASGFDENTLILFWSDNGPSAEGRENNVRPVGTKESFVSYGGGWAEASATPFKGQKTQLTEGGAVTSMLVRWPAVIKKSFITHNPGHLTDITATCYDVAGAQYPATVNGKTIPPLEGVSFGDVFKTGSRLSNPICMQFRGHRMVRHGKWKIYAKDNGSWQLYDLEKDGTETTNLASHYPDVVNQLAAIYTEWEINYSLPSKYYTTVNYNPSSSTAASPRPARVTHAEQRLQSVIRFSGSKIELSSWQVAKFKSVDLFNLQGDFIATLPINGRRTIPIQVNKPTHALYVARLQP
jgi:arylsulfatase